MRHRSFAAKFPKLLWLCLFSEWDDYSSKPGLKASGWCAFLKEMPGLLFERLSRCWWRDTSLSHVSLYGSVGSLRVCLSCCRSRWQRPLLSTLTFLESVGRRSSEMTPQIQPLAFHLLLTVVWLDIRPAFLCLEPIQSLHSVTGRLQDNLQRYSLKPR